jgi:vancomycin resistance protein VanJ
LRFDQLQAGSTGLGVPADGPDGEGPIAQGAAAVGSSGGDGAQDAADGAPISGEAAASAEGSATSAESVQPVADTPAPQSTALAVATPVFAIGDIIRSAADQASATWKTAAVPPQRRESPATSFRTVDVPTVRVPAALEPVPPAASDEAPTRLNPIVPAGPAAAESSAFATRTADLDTEAGVLGDSDVPEVADVPEIADGGTGAGAATRADDDTHWPGARRQIALLTMIVSVLILAVLLGHRYFPDVLGFGSLIDTFLPWTFAPLLLALPAAVLSLKKWTIGICLLTCAVWTGDFAPTLLHSGGSGPADIRVLSQNVSSGDDTAAPDLSGVARLAERRGADIVVLQGLSKDVEQADQAAPARYAYHIAMYEFVVWSRFPIGSSQPVDLGSGRPSDASQSGAAAAEGSSGSFGGLLRFTVDVDQNRQVTVYAVHLPQPSLSHDGFGVARNDALEQLVDHVRTEKSPNLIVLGDLDVAQTDRAMRPLLASSTGLVSAQAKAGAGFGFTWPATFPVVRLDDVLTRGLAPVASVVLPAVGPQQAHRPIEADLKF